jgi:hypothetical protein
VLARRDDDHRVGELVELVGGDGTRVDCDLVPATAW